MEVQRMPDQEEFIRKGMDEGRYKSADEAVQEAMVHWKRLSDRAWSCWPRLMRGKLILKLDDIRTTMPTARPGLLEELKREDRDARDGELMLACRVCLPGRESE